MVPQGNVVMGLHDYSDRRIQVLLLILKKLPASKALVLLILEELPISSILLCVCVCD